MTRSSNQHPAVDGTLSALAIGGLAAAVTAGASVRSNPDTFSDAKTLYSSAWSFAHGRNPYSLASIQAVFTRQDVVQPHHWFGHYPVYPPTTLAWLAPFSFVPMSYAVCALAVLSTLAFIAAVAGLLQYPLANGPLSLPWKAALVALCASGPLLGFALVVGNISVLATALGILAFTSRRTGRLWLPASSLALAMLLKPHLGVWFCIAMCLLPLGARRAIALRAIGLAGAFTGLLLCILALRGSLATQLAGFLSVLHSEAAPGASMNIFSREVLPIEAQITSLQSLLGFWTSHAHWIALIAIAALGAAGVRLARTTLRARTDAEALLALAAWLALGLLTTYHRALDAIALVVLLPLLLDRLREDPRDWQVWGIFAAYLGISFGPAVEFVRLRMTTLPPHSLLAFVLLRQAGIAAACLLLALLFAVHRRRSPYRILTRDMAVNLPSAGRLMRDARANATMRVHRLDLANGPRNVEPARKVSVG